ncbi:hypothetical protein ACQ5TV_08550 [Acetobacter ghanensis]|uniref:hypothetical protein n=1 Tax=Acetobacter ghanensis TaxID=431306 RepID=UPI003D34519E
MCAVWLRWLPLQLWLGVLGPVRGRARITHTGMQAQACAMTIIMGMAVVVVGIAPALVPWAGPAWVPVGPVAAAVDAPVVVVGRAAVRLAGPVDTAAVLLVVVAMVVAMVAAPVGVVRVVAGAEVAHAANGLSSICKRPRHCAGPFLYAVYGVGA